LTQRAVVLLAAAALAPGLAAAQAAATPEAAWMTQVAPLAQSATLAAFPDRPGLRVEVVPGTLDPRLNLAPCNKVQPYLPAGHRAWGRTRIGLRCLEGPVAWNVSLPVTVKVYAPALVARQALSAGTALSAEQLETTEVEWTASDSPVHTDPLPLAGRQLARPLAPGQAVREADLRKRQWFAAGDPVKLLVSGPGFAITGEGTALSPGLEGQLVRVRTEGGRTVSGRATGDRLVELRL
jgi:flagella basal body P-ring formation protein FlgA